MEIKLLYTSLNEENYIKNHFHVVHLTFLGSRFMPVTLRLHVYGRYADYSMDNDGRIVPNRNPRNRPFHQLFHSQFTHVFCPAELQKFARFSGWYVYTIFYRIYYFLRRFLYIFLSSQGLMPCNGFLLAFRQQLSFSYGCYFQRLMVRNSPRSRSISKIISQLSELKQRQGNEEDREERNETPNRPLRNH